jgi:hypothetical protein
MKCSATSLGAAALVISACGTGKSFVGNRFEDRHVEYRVGAPGDGWREVQLETSNISWFNDAIGAGLLVNSHCEGVQDSPLEGLTGELLIGTTERDVLEQTVRPWSGREAMETIATGKLDGVARKHALFVVKKDGCVYDIVYDAPVSSFDAGFASYVAVRDGFSIAARRDR